MRKVEWFLVPVIAGAIVILIGSILLPISGNLRGFVAFVTVSGPVLILWGLWLLFTPNSDSPNGEEKK